jgi:alkylhydroperoxidase/carboxymuconolactone decarboxylase family protein YurZ
MSEIHFPLTALDCDDPWTRDGMTMQEYLEVGDDWQLAIHKRGANDGWTKDEIKQLLRSYAKTRGNKEAVLNRIRGLNKLFKTQ